MGQVREQYYVNVSARKKKVRIRAEQFRVVFEWNAIKSDSPLKKGVIIYTCSATGQGLTSIKKNHRKSNLLSCCHKAKKIQPNIFFFNGKGGGFIYLFFFGCNTLQLIYAHVLLLSSFTFWSLSLPEGPTFPMLAMKEKQVRFNSSPT